MRTEAILAALLRTPPDESVIAEPLPHETAEAVVQALKERADAVWGTDTRQAIDYAERIITIGQQRDDPAHLGLGYMARGDAYNILGNKDRAAEDLQRAAEYFTEAGDEVGWARTRIGWVGVSIHNDKLDEALSDADRAEAIFRAVGDLERLLRLQVNRMAVLNECGRYSEALRLAEGAFEAAEQAGPAGDVLRATIHNWVGYAYTFLGELRQARHHYEQATYIAEAHGQHNWAKIYRTNIAYVAQAQGHYYEALDILHDLFEHDLDDINRSGLAWRIMIECYLHLNRLLEAKTMAQELVSAYQQAGAHYDAALAYRHLAEAQARLGDFEAAERSLQAAKPLFESAEAAEWVADVVMRQGSVALRQGHIPKARQSFEHAAARITGDHHALADLHLMQAQAAHQAGDITEARHQAEKGLALARQYNRLLTRYSAHLLLGHVAAESGHLARARRRYQAAAATIRRAEQSLTVNLRPRFLEDKNEAQRALIRLELQRGALERAFATLEHAKAGVLLGYLATHSPTADEGGLSSELDTLREEYNWLYQQASQPGAEPYLAERLHYAEREIMRLNEHRALHALSLSHHAPVAHLGEVQAALAPDERMLVTFHDETDLWCMVLSQEGATLHRRPSVMPTVNASIQQMQFNVSCALSVAAEVPAMGGLVSAFDTIARRLGRILFEGIDLDGVERLTVVPYGSLHYLPFHLLRPSNIDYLVSLLEVSVMPATSLLLRERPHRPPGALVLAHSQGGALPQTHVEADLVQSILGGRTYREGDASRQRLTEAESQVLHIAAHGEHRLDQPELSYILLGDGQLYTDDLLRLDLSCDLVTLSACETGRVRIFGSDEPLGIGRGFLYAGAQALLTSMWPVVDGITLDGMADFYGHLTAGRSKSFALRATQLMLQERCPHPALWGAFQLIGNSEPLPTGG